MVLATCLPLLGFSQANSVLYFQGDKTVGIYVKVEGQMMERLSKNFVMVNGLEAGMAEFEVLFEMNKYPAQTFKIQIPKDGIRGFLLSKIDGNQYVLIDVQTQGVIKGGNETDDAFLAISPKNKLYFVDNRLPELSKHKQTDNIKKKDPKQDNRFLDNVDLNQQKDSDTKKQSQNTILKNGNIFKNTEDGQVKNDDENFSDSEIKEEIEIASENQLCPSALSESAFDAYASSFKSQSDDEARLKYFKRTYKRNCFTTEQVGALAHLMSSQSTQYEMMQLAFERTIDPSNYKLLATIFNSDFIRDQFLDWLK